jgi:hypothetical protein
MCHLEAGAGRGDVIAAGMILVLWVDWLVRCAR